MVRGDDLLSSSPRQAYLAKLLGYPEPTYAHVALVLNEDGARLAKRDGAVTLAEIGVRTRAARRSPHRWATPRRPSSRCSPSSTPAALPREPWIYRPAAAEQNPW